MLFFEQHLNRHHFFHAPHLWFFALLTSPIHFAEMHYKKKYKLNYENAKKLFIFDTSLLLLALAIISATVFWFIYKPNVTALVYLSFKLPTERVASGDYVEYTVNYKNSSSVTLVSPVIKLDLPAGFVFEQAEPAENYHDFAFVLPDLTPQTAGAVKISGWIYGMPDREEKIIATLSYQQEKRKVKEEKTSLLIKILRGSTLTAEISAPRYILAGGSVPLSLNLKNNGQRKLTQIRVPLNQKDKLFLTSATTTLGHLEQNIWLIENLGPGQSAQLAGELKNENLTGPEKISAAFLPSIRVNQIDFQQNPVEHIFTVAHPQAEIKSAWQNNPEKIRPGETAVLQLEIVNNGNVNLVNNQIEIPLLPNITDLARWQKLNLGQIKNQTFIITADELAGLKQIKTNEKISHNIQVPILLFPQGNNDLFLNLLVKYRGQVEEVKNSFYDADGNVPALKIGTQISIQPEARYYTNEGDQLGRGPLPPQVGKETKYWIFIPLSNTTSKIKNLRLTADLPAFVEWTGKSSISHGNNPVYDSGKRQASWTLFALPAFTQAGIYFEIAFTPRAEQAGSTPELLKNISFSADDAFIEETITKNLGNLDISLPNDKIGREKGVKIVN